MARLAAALWSLCVTTVLVTSATQGKCVWAGEGLGLQTQMEGGKQILWTTASTPDEAGPG